jgi:hypothetical protein
MITGCHERVLTEGFLQLASHYLFDYHFCTVRRANEKGVVEGICKYGRSNFLVPVPQVKDFEELNVLLAESCRKDGGRKLRGKSSTKLELLKEEQFLPLPASVFDACRKEPVCANSLSLVRFENNDYSVPVSYAHHDLTVKGYVDKVEVCTATGEHVASHKRSWKKEDILYNPIHYLPLLERKPGALDYAAPLFNFKLPSCFDDLRRKLEGQKGHAGTKAYIEVLRLIEKYRISRVEKAINKAISLPYPSPEIVKLYCIPEELQLAKTFCLDGHEHLKGIEVGNPDLRGYSLLLNREGVA